MNENLAYQDIPDREPWREELIAGKLVAMAPPTLWHKLIADNLFYLFRHYLAGKECQPIGDGAAVFLTDEDYYIPDFMVVCDRDKLKTDGVHGAPDLVAEVLSPSTAQRDKGRKMRVYESSGVREYWLVDPRGKAVEQYVLAGNRFELAGVYFLYSPQELIEITEEDRAAVQTEFKCSLYDDLVIRLEDIFYRVP